MVRIVTDSTADLTPEQQSSAGITVVPLNVHFGDHIYRDRVDLSGAEFFRKLTSSTQHPRTSQPSVGAFEETFRGLRQEGDDVVAVLLSGKVSGTYNAAQMAARSIDQDRIDVIDSQSASMALGFLALEGALKAKTGAARQAVAEHIRGLVPKARILAALDTLVYLERGGRIGRARALLGSLLNVKPIITVQEGEVVPVTRTRSWPQALDRLVELLQRDPSITRLAVLHGAAETEAEQLRARVAPRYPNLDVTLTEIGPVLGTYTGPRVVGFTYLVA